jgi:hypothetical protein
MLKRMWPSRRVGSFAPEFASGDGTPSVRDMPEVGRMAPFRMILSNAG